MPIGIMGSKSLVLLDWSSAWFSNKVRERTINYVFVLFSSTKLKHPGLNQAIVKSNSTHNNFRHCLVSFSPFVRQPFTKQLYAFKHVPKLSWNLAYTMPLTQGQTLQNYGFPCTLWVLQGCVALNQSLAQEKRWWLVNKTFFKPSLHSAIRTGTNVEKYGFPCTLWAVQGSYGITVGKMNNRHLFYHPSKVFLHVLWNYLW